jgi:hypothetical protein
MKITTIFGFVMAYQGHKTTMEEDHHQFWVYHSLKGHKPFENIMTNLGSTMAYKVIKPFENITTNFRFVMLHWIISNACHSRLSLVTLYQALSFT